MGNPNIGMEDIRKIINSPIEEEEKIDKIEEVLIKRKILLNELIAELLKNNDIDISLSVIAREICIIETCLESFIADKRRNLIERANNPILYEDLPKLRQFLHDLKEYRNMCKLLEKK